MIRRRDGLRMSDRFRVEGRERPYDEDESEASRMDSVVGGYDDHDDEPSHEPMKRQAWEHGHEDAPRKRSPRQRRAEA